MDQTQLQREIANAIMQKQKTFRHEGGVVALPSPQSGGTSQQRLSYATMKAEQIAKSINKMNSNQNTTT
tara:strand:+ start:1018 stop:1224 length:207 start_codon:yes stop_codon:yes gene_type:complete